MRTFLLLSLLITIAAVPFASADEQKHPILVGIGNVMGIIGFPGLILCGLVLIVGSVGGA